MKNKFVAFLLIILATIGIANGQTSKEYAVADIAQLTTDLGAGTYDIFVLSESGGNYAFITTIIPTKSLTIRAKTGLAAKPVISFSNSGTGTALSVLTPAVANLIFTFEDVELNGVNGTIGGSQPIFLKSTGANNQVVMSNCYIHDFKNANDNGFLRLDAIGSSVNIQNSYMDNCTGKIINLNSPAAAPSNVYGDITLKNCSFSNILNSNAGLVYYSGGTKSAYGQNLTVDHCTFYNYSTITAFGLFTLRSMSGLVSITNSIFHSVANGYSFVNLNASAPAAVIDNNYLAGFATPPTGTNTLTTAPIFTDASTRNFALKNFHALKCSDDLIAGNTSYYTTPYASIGLLSLDKNTLIMVFDKAMDETLAETVGNYSVSLAGASAIQPTAAVLSAINSREVTLTVDDMSGLAIGSTVSVTASNLKDAAAQSITGNVISTLTIQSPLLTDLQSDAVTVANFDKNTFSYSIELPYGTTTIPTVTYTVENFATTTVLSNAAALPGETKVTVNTTDGIKSQVYTINYSVAAASTDAKLTEIKVDVTSVPDFVSGTLTYNVILPVGTTVVPTNITWTTSHAGATVTKTDATDLTGTTEIAVTAQDGTTKLVYKLTYTVATLSTNANLSDIKMDGTTINGYDKAKTTYDIELPIGTTSDAVPVITYTIEDSKSTAEITAATSLPGSTTIKVTAEDASTQTYTINFTVKQPSTDAKLTDIKISDVSLAGFAADVLSYDIALPYSASPSVPTAITYTKSQADATVSVVDAIAVPGTTEITVTAQDGTTKLVYKLNFTVTEPAHDAKLSSLEVNAKTVTGFSAGLLTYNIVLPFGTTVVPTGITYTVNEANATVSVSDASALPGTTEITVTAQDGTTKLVYEINFSASPNVLLTKEYTVEQIAELNAELAANDYDVYVLSTDGGSYVLTATMIPAKSFTICAKSGLAAKPVVSFSNAGASQSLSVFEPVAENLAFTFEDIELNGVNGTIGGSQPVLIKSAISAINCQIAFRNCYVHHFRNASDNGLLRLEGVGCGVEMQNCIVDNCIGRIILLQTVNPAPYTQYGDITMKNCTFSNMVNTSSVGTGLLYFRSTLLGANLSVGNNLTVDHCTFYNYSSSVDLFALRWMTGEVKITNNIFYSIGMGHSFVNPNTSAPAQILDYNYLAGFATPPEGTNTLTNVPIFEDPATLNFKITNYNQFFVADGSICGNTNYYDADSIEAHLADLKVDGNTVDGFDPDVLSYNIVLPYGTTTIPTVTYTLANVDAKADLIECSSLPGSTAVTVTALDNVNQNTYTINFDLATGVYDDRVNNVKIYPIPANDYLFVEKVLNQGVNTEARIIDITGRIIYSQVLKDFSSIINISNLNKGFYFLSILENGKITKSMNFTKVQ